MKNRKFTFISLLAASSFLLGGCGTKQNSLDKIFGLDTTSAFRIIGFDPQYQAENVPIQSAIRIQVSQPIDSNSILNSMTIMETTVGQAPKNISSEGNISVQGSSAVDDTLVFTPGRSLLPGATYMVSIAGTLRSRAGLNLSPFTYRFSTGTFDNSGANGFSLAGPPKVIAMNLIRTQYSCYSVSYTVNEDLAYAPMVNGEYLPGGGTMALYPWQPYPGNLRTYYLEFPDGGCGVQGSLSVKIQTVQAIDLTGESMVLDGASRRECKIGVLGGVKC